MPEAKPEAKPDVERLSKLLMELLAKGAGLSEEQVRAIVADEVKRGPARLLIDVRKDESEPVSMGLTHYRMPHLLNAWATRKDTNKHAFLSGPPGSGKSHAPEQMARALGLEFSLLSVSSQTLMVEFFGYRQPDGHVVRTPFRERYEHGGIFMLDEGDKGNANVLSSIQTALSNKQAAFPDGIVPMHPDFFLCLTANTFGNGRTSEFIGSNVLDSAFLDRFLMLHWPVDEALEETLTLARGGQTAACWLAYVRKVRKVFEENRMKVLVSPRASISGAALLAHGVEWADVVEQTISARMTREQLSVLAQVTP